VSASEGPAYAPSWYTDTTVAAPERAALATSLDAEVCIIGAGLAGLTTARELALRGWSVAVVEARRIAWNASGRNTGFVLPGFAQDMDAVVRRVGLERAKRLWELSDAGAEYVRATIRELSMPGVRMVESGWLKVSKSDAAEKDLAQVRLLGQDIGAVVEGWPIERVREALHTDHYFHGVHFPTAFHIHPLNYALGLANAAELAGVRIFENTPAVSIDAAGVRKWVDTPSGRLRAAHIVLAGNVHLGALLPRVSGTLLPVWTYVATTAPMGARLSEAIGYRGAVSDTDLADSHYRIVGGDRLMWSGGITTWEGSPRRFASRLKASIESVYPQLAPVDIEHVWTGVLGNTLHRMPQIGELSPGLWLASGFGGHGLNTTALAGNIIARAIDEGDDTWKLFLPFELVWAGGAVGRLAGQAYYSWVHAREQHLARQSRRREEEYRLSQKRQGAGQSDSSRYPPKDSKRSNGSKAPTPPATPVSEPADEGPGQGAPPRFDWRDRLAPNRARVAGRE
jgi:glycine/D-amino acid oxidase-like deaminating enzyme